MQILPVHAQHGARSRHSSPSDSSSTLALGANGNLILLENIPFKAPATLLRSPYGVLQDGAGVR